jgi:DNA-binding NarL/FixJ family response regulator
MNTTIFAPRVLLFDERPLTRHGAAMALAQANPGWDIVTTGRISDFLCYAGPSTWDLLLLDLPTLGAGAEKLLQVCSRNCPDSKIVVLNVPEDDILRAQLAAAGANGYFSHSISTMELCELTTSLLAIPKPDSTFGLSSTQSVHGRVAQARDVDGLPHTVSPDPNHCLQGGIRSVWGQEPQKNQASGRLVLLRQESPRFLAQLTDRQVAVLQLMAEGRSTKEIARHLGLAVGTVKVHLSGAYRALGAHSRVEALAKAGMIKPSPLHA